MSPLGIAPATSCLWGGSDSGMLPSGRHTSSIWRNSFDKGTSSVYYIKRGVVGAVFSTTIYIILILIPWVDTNYGHTIYWIGTGKTILRFLNGGTPMLPNSWCYMYFLCIRELPVKDTTYISKGRFALR